MAEKCVQHIDTWATTLRKDLRRQPHTLPIPCNFFSSTFSFVASKAFSNYNLNAVGVIQEDEGTSRTYGTDISYGHICTWTKNSTRPRLSAGCGWFTWYLAMDNGMGGFRG